jgi:hypothetical protein
MIITIATFLKVYAVWPASALRRKERFAAKTFLANVARRLEPLTSTKDFRPEFHDVERCGRNRTPPVRKLVARYGHFKKLV